MVIHTRQGCVADLATWANGTPSCVDRCPTGSSGCPRNPLCPAAHPSLLRLRLFQQIEEVRGVDLVFILFLAEYIYNWVIFNYTNQKYNIDP